MDELGSFAFKHYEALDKKLGIETVSCVGIDKWIKSEDYRSFWNNRAREADFKQYLKPVDDDDLGHVLQAFAVDCNKLQSAYLDYLQDINAYSGKPFDSDELHTDKKQLHYKGHEFESVTFCEGSVCCE